jgi:hypothetical protein
MLCQNIFLECDRWSTHTHPAAELTRLAHAPPEQIKRYFAGSRPSAALRHITATQLRKAEGGIRSQKMRMIYKERLRRMPRGEDADGLLELDGKFSSKTQLEDVDDMQVEQYFNFWDTEERTPALGL